MNQDLEKEIELSSTDVDDVVSVVTRKFGPGYIRRIDRTHVELVVPWSAEPGDVLDYYQAASYAEGFLAGLHYYDEVS